ncbi:MAG TPA: polyprenyl synthetase family protein, partial [Fibrobacteraceae bacterium]|nr:polyprenyl synthetase family protein [Fibrobacteraceae bacterium]
LSKSMEMVVLEPDRRIPAILSQASSRLVAGEVLEMDLAGKFDANVEEYQKVIDGKTASLFEACGRCGAILAGLGDDLVEACGDFGRHVGLTFQIVDDLLDFGVGATDLGKATFSDLANGVITLPIVYYFSSCANASDRQTMIDLLGQAARQVPGAADQIKERLVSSKAFDQVMETAMGHIHGALAIMDRLPAGPHREMMTEICTAMVHRSN